MKRSVLLPAFVVLASLTLLAAPPPQPGTLTFLESSDAKGRLPRSKLLCSMSELARELKLPGNELPRVLVIHASPRDAEAVGIRSTALRHNTGTMGGPYYELWIVGDADPADYTAAFEQILERHFSLSVTETERKRVITRVLRVLLATVDAHGE